MKPCLILCLVTSLLAIKNIYGQNNRKVDTFDVQSKAVIELADYLNNKEYRDVFLSGSDSKADSIWDANTKTLLEKIIITDTLKGKCRFFASVILMNNNWVPPDSLKKILSLIFANALKRNYLEFPNPWGIPGDAGDLGHCTKMLGKETVRAFRPLLRKRKQVVYAGSKAATIGHIYRYRVKDIAASHIADILNIPFDGQRKPFIRNFAIWRIRILALRY